MTTTVAAIDAGSNAFRLAIGRFDGRGRLQPVAAYREAVRLGTDVFADGAITAAASAQALQAFLKFRWAIDAHGAGRVRAVGTSALREAVNREEFIESVRRAAGIRLEVIGPAEEARLVLRAVARAVDLRDRRVLLVDVGGGSVELVVVDGGILTASASLDLGTVRLLRRRSDAERDADLDRHIGREMAAAVRHLLDEAGEGTVTEGIATGGNAEGIAELRLRAFDDGRPGVVSGDDLDVLINLLLDRTPAERVRSLGLAADRADVIVPGALLLRAVLREFRLDALRVPGVGLKDGVLLDLADEAAGETGEPKIPQMSRI